MAVVLSIAYTDALITLASSTIEMPAASASVVKLWRNWYGLAGTAAACRALGVALRVPPKRGH